MALMVWEHLIWPFLQVSALREAGLAREMHAAGLPDLKWLYMGEIEVFAHFYSEPDLLSKASTPILARR